LKKPEFNLKIERNVNEYLSLCIEESKDKRKLTMIQPHLLTRLIQNSEEEIEGKRKFLTSASFVRPGHIIVFLMIFLVQFCIG
jgi:hypothetical protein